MAPYTVLTHMLQYTVLTHMLQYTVRGALHAMLDYLNQVDVIVGWFSFSVLRSQYSQAKESAALLIISIFKYSNQILHVSVTALFHQMEIFLMSCGYFWTNADKIQPGTSGRSVGGIRSYCMWSDRNVITDMWLSVKIKPTWCLTIAAMRAIWRITIINGESGHVSDNLCRSSAPSAATREAKSALLQVLMSWLKWS